MANSCLLFSGLLIGSIGWIGIVIATATSDWVVTCKYGMNTCRKMDELGSKGLWMDCVISTALYHCISLNQIFDLPAYVQTCRALMILASILGLPALVLVLTAMPCINMGGEEAGSERSRRGMLGGVLLMIVALCGAVSTVWFPIGAHQEQGLMSFGFSLYAGWVGTLMCLLSGSMIGCCSSEKDASYGHSSPRFYYTKQGGVAHNTAPASVTHAKSAHV